MVLFATRQVDWLNEYHRRTREVTGRELQNRGKKAAFAWLWRETEPLDYEQR